MKGEEDMDRVEKTVDLHKNHRMNCAQAILTVYGEPYGITPEQAKMLGRPLGGGFGLLGKTCGYVSGAALVLGFAHNGQDDKQSGEDTRKAVRELFHRFEEKYGTSLCNGLLEIDLNTEEGRRKMREENLPARFCYGSEKDIGRTTARILEELLQVP